MSSRSKDHQYTEEILAGDFDQLLNEAEALATERSVALKKGLFTPSNTFQNTYVTNATDKQLEAIPASSRFDLDDLSEDLLEISPVWVKPITPRSKKPIELDTFSCRYQQKGSWIEFFAQKKFCHALQVEIRKMYSVETTITKSRDKSILEDLTYVIEFESTDEAKVHEARYSVQSLFNTVETKLIDDEAGFWVRYPDCIPVVQAYSDQNEHLHLLYEHGNLGLMISYFSKDKSSALLNLCTSNAILDRIIKEKFLTVHISLPSTSDLTTDNESYLAQDILKLKSQMKSQAILMVLERRRIDLFGLIDLVRSVETQLEEIKKKYASNTIKLNLELQQIKYLLDMYGDELRALETKYQNTKIVKTLIDREFTAPSYLHDTIEKRIMAMATLCAPIDFEIQDEVFGIIAHSECSNLIKIGRQNKCQIEIQEATVDYTSEIPTTTTKDHVSNKLTAAAIEIHKGDLAEQTVDLVVVCSTSAYLLEGILEKAGPTVKQEYTEAAMLPSTDPFETNSGQLKCRKLLFLPWNPDQKDNDAFYQSIRDFVAKAVKHAVSAHHTSIAFPSIGCGKFNVDKNIVANEMLVEAQKQLLTANVLLQIVFVILPNQNDVYEVFQAKLENLQRDIGQRKNSQLSYRLTTLTIAIASSNAEKQEQCSTEINDYVQKATLVQEYLQQDGLKKWTQLAINEFYQLCWEQGVVVDMQILTGYLKLSGSKESVARMENEYYRAQANQSEQARLIAVAQNKIWAYKIDDSTSEKYSPELNARIEDAFSSRVKTFSYTNGQLEECTIHFKSMTETCISKQTRRDVIRHADFTLPEHWEVQSDNIKQFKVKLHSSEYQEICALFNKTMAGKYAAIIRISRIQNKPWYMQYNSYKTFSSKEGTEERLFHGCPQKSAQLIIHSFFNRSFAGVNGVVYGQGAYFSAKANYSHGFTEPSAPNGERHMFVADVVVGNTVLGNKSMKTPPDGFDSTTDGDHIFVTYRDDQAYGAYLIIYN